MKNSQNSQETEKHYEYAILGAGPAGIVALAKLLAFGIAPKDILWIDPEFSVGDFGGKLSVGSSVPGNTSVASYLRVNNEIYKSLATCKPSAETLNNFALSSLPTDKTCSLKIAAIPLQFISDNLLKLVDHIKGHVSHITNKNIFTLSIDDHPLKKFFSKRVILALGADPKTLSLPEPITFINPDTAFIESELNHYIKNNPSIKTVAVIGSSHSAALAVMHLLKTGVKVKQFMNKEYKFAEKITLPDGSTYTKFDNTGLKGEVAAFTRKLLTAAKTDELAQNWDCYISDNVDELIQQEIQACSHAVVSIGYKTRNSLKINDIPLSHYSHDLHSTEIISPDHKKIPGLFGIGIAFPPQVISKSGEVEYAVGVEKFWVNIHHKILKQWQESVEASV